MYLEWISVEDRLPDDDVNVLCYELEGYEIRGHYTETMDYGNGELVPLFMSDGRYISITHWMPLPEPPK